MTLFFLILSAVLTIIVIRQSMLIDELESLTDYQRDLIDCQNKQLENIYDNPVYSRGYQEALQDMRDLLNKEKPPTPPTTGSNAVKPKEQMIVIKRKQGRMMDPIKINKNQILILNTEMLLHPRDMERIQKEIVRQIAEGAVIIPNGFSYEIISKESEGE